MSIGLRLLLGGKWLVYRIWSLKQLFIN
jgi:hypothetical protein